MMAKPSWSEIDDNLFSYEDGDDNPDHPRKCQTTSDHPDVIAHVFVQKIMSMLKDIENRLFGDVQGYVFTIEFQKQGVPHIHLLIFLKQQFKICNAKHVNSIVSAQIPDPVAYPLLYATVTKCMIHGPCGPEFPNAPCMVNRNCSKHYPKDFCAKTHLGEDGYPNMPDQTMVGPILTLAVRLLTTAMLFHISTKYDCHINVEVCTSLKAIKYIYKYIYKGHDHATVGVFEDIDKILEHIGSHYIGPSEAFWHITEFPMHEEKPSVYCLPVHPPDQQTIYFNNDDDLGEVMDDDATKRLPLLSGLLSIVQSVLQSSIHILTSSITLFRRKSPESRSHAVKPMSLGGCTLFTHL